MGVDMGFSAAVMLVVEVAATRRDMYMLDHWDLSAWPHALDILVVALVLLDPKALIFSFLRGEIQAVAA
jgi:hypothetical protein